MTRRPYLNTDEDDGVLRPPVSAVPGEEARRRVQLSGVRQPHRRPPCLTPHFRVGQLHGAI